MKKIFLIFIAITNLNGQTVNNAGQTAPGIPTPKSNTNLNTNPNTNMNSSPNFNNSDPNFKNTTAPGVASPITSIIKDSVGIEQSSTVSADCVTMKAEGTLCGPNAVTWCNSHIGSIECSNFNTSKNTNPINNPASAK